jgi:hypothetical protein
LPDECKPHEILAREELRRFPWRLALLLVDSDPATAFVFSLQILLGRGRFRSEGLDPLVQDQKPQSNFLVNEFVWPPFFRDAAPCRARPAFWAGAMLNVVGPDSLVRNLLQIRKNG